MPTGPLASAKNCTQPPSDARTGGRTIVLIHGSCVTWHKWREPIDQLSSDYCVIAPDLPGHGSRAIERFTLSGAIHAVSDAMDAGGVDRAVLVGSSLGGYVAMAFADRHPMRVSALVISGATINYTGAWRPYLRVIGGLLSCVALQPMVTRMVRREIETIFSNRPSSVRDEQRTAGVFPSGAGASFVALAGLDFSEMLRRYPGPVAVINGERDGANRRAQARFVALRPEVTSVIIPNAGHSCSAEQPEAFTTAVRAFLTNAGLGTEHPAVGGRDEGYGRNV